MTANQTLRREVRANVQAQLYNPSSTRAMRCEIWLELWRMICILYQERRTELRLADYSNNLTANMPRCGTAWITR